MDLITPDSSLKPSGAVLLVLLISSTLWKFFGLDPSLTGYILSLLFAYFFICDFKIKLLKKLFYVLINSLFIFFTAFGVNTFISHKGEYKVTYLQTGINSQRSFLDSWADININGANGGKNKIELPGNL